MKRRSPSCKPADLAFLAIAVVVHGCLLLLPLQSWNERQQARPDRITVQLLAPPAQKQDINSPERVEELLPDEEAVTATPVKPIVSPKPQSQPQAETDPEAPEWVEKQPEVLPPSRQLLDSLSALRERDLQYQAEKSKRALGGAPIYQMPRNWEPHTGAEYLAALDNTFNGMTAPAEVEIVDRWLAADGSHRVVVNLPNGETMCGRAEPYNPMQPLVEHIMLFGPCGGGGKRSFSMPERYHLNR